MPWQPVWSILHLPAPPLRNFIFYFWITISLGTSLLSLLPWVTLQQCKTPDGIALKVIGLTQVSLPRHGCSLWAVEPSELCISGPWLPYDQLCADQSYSNTASPAHNNWPGVNIIFYWPLKFVQDDFECVSLKCLCNNKRTVVLPSWSVAWTRVECGLNW